MNEGVLDEFVASAAMPASLAGFAVSGSFVGCVGSSVVSSGTFSVMTELDSVNSLRVSSTAASGPVEPVEPVEEVEYLLPFGGVRMPDDLLGIDAASVSVCDVVSVLVGVEVGSVAGSAVGTLSVVVVVVVKGS